VPRVQATSGPRLMEHGTWNAEQVTMMAPGSKLYIHRTGSLREQHRQKAERAKASGTKLSIAVDGFSRPNLT